MLPPSGFCCRLIGPGDLTQCLHWALPRYRLDRASWILSQVNQRVQAGRSSEIIAGAASQYGPAGTLEYPLALAIAIKQPAGAATLLLLQAVSAEELQRNGGCDRPAAVGAEQGGGAVPESCYVAADNQDLIRPLLEPVLQRLRSLGITFLQAACHEPSQAALLRAAGFEPLANLSLMELPRAAYAEAMRVAGEEADKGSVPSAALRWTALDAIGKDWESDFSSVAADTFIDTSDCPRLSDYRTTGEIVAGYCAAPTFDRSLSKLLRVGEQWAGCLVLTRHEAQGIGNHHGSDSESPVALELTYMGLKPDYRRRRLAAQLLAETVRMAAQLDAAQILLAVDRDNQPARASYQRFGWRDVTQESVWGRRV